MFSLWGATCNFDSQTPITCTIDYLEAVGWLVSPVARVFSWCRIVSIGLLLERLGIRSVRL